jgi:putative transcriptional regulator
MEQQLGNLGKRLIKSAKEGRAIARGEADASTYKVFVPATIDVKAIRTRRGLTQEEFCIKYALSVASLAIGSKADSRPIRRRERI